MMACSHQITHYTTPCTPTERCPITPTVHLEDTCAACHPSHQLSLTKRVYDRKTEQARQGAGVAFRSGNTAEGVRLARLIGELELERTERMHRIKRRQQFWTLVDDEVVWPGKPCGEADPYAECLPEQQRALLRREYEMKQAEAVHGAAHAPKYGMKGRDTMFNQECCARVMEIHDQPGESPVMFTMRQGVVDGKDDAVWEWLLTLP